MPAATSKVGTEADHTKDQLAAKVQKLAQDPVGSERIAEPDSAKDKDSESFSEGHQLSEELGATGSLAEVYKNIHQLKRRLNSFRYELYEARCKCCNWQ